jgi:transcriptional regulator with XRE-family HTH domain
VRNNQSLAEIVAANVRAELGRSRITQREAATRIGVSQGALSKRLNGYLPFDVRELELLAALLHVSADSLLRTAIAA